MEATVTITLKELDEIRDKYRESMAQVDELEKEVLTWKQRLASTVSLIDKQLGYGIVIDGENTRLVNKGHN